MFDNLHEIIDGLWLGNIAAAEDVIDLKKKELKKY